MKLSATDRRNLQTLLLMSVFEPQAIGSRLATARLEAGLTQEEVGDLVGLSTRMVQYYEAGTHTPYKHLRKFGEVLNRPIDWLLYGDRETPDEAERLSQMAAELAEIRGMLEQVLEARDEPAEPKPGQAAEGS